MNFFGRIDVVVNNAGYGLVGGLEELTDREARENFDVNVFGTLNVIRNVMPFLRAQRFGHIFNLSSIGGFFGHFPGWGIYCATALLAFNNQPIMWTCPVCQQAFIHQNQTHSCQERTVADFLAGKSAHTVALFHDFVTYYQSLGAFTLHPAKHRIGFAARTRFGYVHRLGKNFIDVVLHFPTAYRDTFCFHKVAGGPLRYNHYFRLYDKQELTEELESFLRLALRNDTGNNEA